MANVNIYLKDPIYSNLKKEISVSDSSPLQFNVLGYNPGLFDLETNEGRAGNCFGTISLGVSQFLSYRENIPTSWAKTSLLSVKPMAGEMWNAFYDRKNLKFFFNWDQIREKTLYASSSPGIILHELGHALLDSIRPDLWNYSAMFEVWAFHEAFGDIFARAGAISHDEVLKQALIDTDNDLSKANLISGLAEQFGRGVRKIPEGIPFSLREATDFFAYKDPLSLPKTGNNNELLQEVHSFSRVFSGMMYDFFVGIYREKLNSLNPFAAAKEAMSITLRYVISTAKYVAVRADFFDSYARCLLFVDFQEGQPYSKILYEVFNKRGILHEIKTLEYKPNPKGKFHEFIGSKRLKIYHKHQKLVVSQEAGIRSLDFNPLYNVKVDISDDRHQEFDLDGHLDVDEYANRKTTVDSVVATLDYLNRKDLVGKEERQPFIVNKNALVRKHFSCY